MNFACKPIFILPLALWAFSVGAPVAFGLPTSPLLYTKPEGLHSVKYSEQNSGQILIAQRKKSLSSQGRSSSRGDKTSIDFDAVDISGARKTPMGSIINQNQNDTNYNFVKIRLNWKDEMYQSTKSLDTSSKR